MALSRRGLQWFDALIIGSQGSRCFRYGDEPLKEEEQQERVELWRLASLCGVADGAVMRAAPQREAVGRPPPQTLHTLRDGRQKQMVTPFSGLNPPLPLSHTLTLGTARDILLLQSRLETM